MNEVVKVIRIETAGSTTTVKELKDEINSLRDALLNTEKGSEEYKSILEQLIEDQKKLTDVMRAGQNEAKAAEGSYNSLVNKMAALKKVWRETTDEASRKELGNQIKDINNKLSKMDQSIGDFRRNVGNYTNSITSAFGAMGGAAKGMIGPLNGVKNAFQALSSHPLVAVLTALAALLINGVVKGFKSSEEATNKLTTAFSGFKAIGDVITKLFQGIANVIGDVANAIVNLLDKWGLLGKGFKERQKIAQDEIKLAKQQRENIMKNADLEKEAADLRAKAADKDKYTAQERLNFLEQAGKKEEEIAENEYLALKQEYEIIVAKNSLSQSSAEAKEAEAKAYAAMTAAQTQYLEKTRSNNKAISRVRQEMIRDARNAENALLNLQKELIQQEYDLAVDGSEDQLRLAKELRKKELEIQQAGFKEKIKNRKDYEKAMKMAQEAYNKDIITLENKHEATRYQEQIKVLKNKWFAGVLEGSSEYYTKLGDLQHEYFVRQKEQGLKDIETGAAITKAQYDENLINFNKEANKYYDQAIQAAERETEVINQIILNSIKPMSMYYRIQLEQYRDYYNSMQKLNNESDEAFAARQDEALQRVLDANEKMNNALGNEENLYLRARLRNVNTAKDVFAQLGAEYESAIYKLHYAEIAYENAIELDAENISRTLIEWGKKSQSAFEDYGGLMPTPELITAIVEKDKKTIQMMAEEEGVELKISVEKMFDQLFDDVVLGGLINESVITTYLDDLQGMVDAEQNIIDEHIDTWNGFHDAIEGVMSGVADIYEQDIRAQVKYNKMSVEQAEKEFENVKALRIAMAVIDTIQGSIAAFMGWQDKGQPWGAIIGAVQAAAVTAAGIAQIAQIQQTEFGSAGNASSVSSAAMAQVTPVMVDYTPQVTTNMTGQQEAEDLANAITSKPIRAYVVESDITNAQELTAQRNSESTF